MQSGRERARQGMHYILSLQWTQNWRLEGAWQWDCPGMGVVWSGSSWRYINLRTVKKSSCGETGQCKHWNARGCSSLIPSPSLCERSGCADSAVHVRTNIMSPIIPIGDKLLINRWACFGYLTSWTVHIVIGICPLSIQSGIKHTRPKIFTMPNKVTSCTCLSSCT